MQMVQVGQLVLMAEGFLDFLAYSLLWNGICQGFLDFRAFHSLKHPRIALKLVSGRESEGSQNSQRVVLEGFCRVERGPDYAVFEVGDAFFGEVFHLSSVDVVEEGVDCEVSTQGVFFWGPERFGAGACRRGFLVSVVFFSEVY